MEEKIKLDYSIQSSQERKLLIEKILETTSHETLSPYYLEKMANYLIFAMSKEQKKNKTINTENRLVTINKRQTSFQGLITKFENGENGIYNLIANDKNILLTPKISITKQDIKEIPILSEVQTNIANLEAQIEKTRGRKRYLLKKQLIEMRRDQYTIKTAFKPVTCLNATKSFSSFNFNGKTSIKNNEIKDSSLISLFNPTHVSALLCNYSKLKEQCYGKFYADGYYLMQDLDLLIDKAIKERYPIYFKILVYKIDGLHNSAIQQEIYNEFHKKYSVQYISLLWRKKIPKLITQTATQQFLNWYYTTKEKGKWKKCSRCNQIKLAHNIFFSKNSSSRDGFYSICKECRNQRTQELKNHQKILIIKRIPYTREKGENQNG